MRDDYDQFTDSRWYYYQRSRRARQSTPSDDAVDAAIAWIIFGPFVALAGLVALYAGAAMIGSVLGF